MCTASTLALSAFNNVIFMQMGALFYDYTLFSYELLCYTYHHWSC